MRTLAVNYATSPIVSRASETEVVTPQATVIVTPAERLTETK